MSVGRWRDPILRNLMQNLRQFDQQFFQRGYQLIVGVDEAGRGPLAGPVVAAAVSFKRIDFSVSFTDSKKMTARQRDAAFKEIFEKCYVGLGIMNQNIIDEYNILQATFLAMEAAVQHLVFRLKKDDKDDQKLCLLIDGNRFQSSLIYDVETVINGDSLSLSIAAASVVAKVTRDRILDQYHQIFPQYGFDRHKGYPTKAHCEALKEHGALFIHRKTFGPVRKVCQL